MQLKRTHNLIMEVMEAKDLLQLITEMGACDKVAPCRTIRDLVELLTTPAGLEFCQKHKFPSADIWRAFRSVLPSSVLLDAGKVYKCNVPRMIIAGDTVAHLEYTTCDYRCELIIMPGAKAIVRTSCYGLVFYSLCGGEIEVINTENGKSYAI